MIEVEFTGKVVSNNSETKEGNNGEYTKTEVVLQAATDNGYTDTLAAICFGENALKVKDIAIGTTLHIRGSVSSKEWKGRYFTQVNLYNWEVQEFAPQSQNDGLPF